jgi:hypothetical protein
LRTVEEKEQPVEDGTVVMTNVTVSGAPAALIVYVVVEVVLTDVVGVPLMMPVHTLIKFEETNSYRY